MPTLQALRSPVGSKTKRRHDRGAGLTRFWNEPLTVAANAADVSAYAAMRAGANLQSFHFLRQESAARRWGADRFVAASQRRELAAAVNTCDFVWTVPVALPWAAYVNILKPDGKLCIVGASPGDVQVSAFALIDGQKAIGGSAVGSNAEIRATLEFSVAHQLRPMIELYPLKEVNMALERLRQNHMRYRAVLVNQG